MIGRIYVPQIGGKDRDRISILANLNQWNIQKRSVPLVEYRIGICALFSFAVRPHLNLRLICVPRWNIQKRPLRSVEYTIEVCAPRFFKEAVALIGLRVFYGANRN
jgi:hypothetical protein